MNTTIMNYSSKIFFIIDKIYKILKILFFLCLLKEAILMNLNDSFFNLIKLNF